MCGHGIATRYPGVAAENWAKAFRGQTGMSTQVAAPKGPDSTGGIWSWSHWWPAVVVLLLGVVVYRKILVGLGLEWWQDPNFSHGFFIPLFSGFVLWNDRAKLALVPIRPAAFGLLVQAGALATLIAGQLGAELFLSNCSFVLLLAGLVIYFLGWPMFRAVFFPWAMLFLMIPIPAIIFNQITFPLQFLASKMASAVLPWMGVPVLRLGNVIQLPAMSLEVADACSGIRSLMSLEALAIIFAYLVEKRIWARVVLALSAAPIAVITNGLRIVGTGACVQYWDPQKAEGFFHEFSGWLVFLVAVAMLMIVQSVLRLLGRKEERAA